MNECLKRMCCYIPDEDRPSKGCHKLAVYRIHFGNHPTIGDQYAYSAKIEDYNFTETCANHLEIMLDDNVRFEVLRIPEAA